MSFDHTPPPVPPQAPVPSGGAPMAPAAPAVGAQKNVLGIVALAIAAVGFLFAVIPGAFIIGWLLLPIGLILGIVAVCLKGKKKGFGIAAIIVAVVGTIAGFIAFSVAAVNAIDDAIDEASTSEVAAEPSAAADEDEDEAAADEPAAAAAQDLAVVESAFGRQSYDATTWWYTAIIENPNADFVFSNAEITVEALSADGTILDSGSTYTTILPGRIAVTGSFFEVGQGEIASLEVRGPTADSAISSPADETGAFTIEGVTGVNDSYSTKVSGTVSGTFEAEQEYVTVVVVARNPEGAIVGSEQTLIDRLPTGGTVQFEVSFLDPLPEGTTYEAYATF